MYFLVILSSFFFKISGWSLKSLYSPCEENSRIHLGPLPLRLWWGLQPWPQLPKQQPPTDSRLITWPIKPRALVPKKGWILIVMIPLQLVTEVQDSEGLMIWIDNPHRVHPDAAILTEIPVIPLRQMSPPIILVVQPSNRFHWLRNSIAFRILIRNYTKYKCDRNRNIWSNFSVYQTKSQIHILWIFLFWTQMSGLEKYV